MTILSVVGIICKLVGALYRIPLAWLIGDEGLGTYQLVFPTYNILLTISSAGLPVAVSRMVSFSLAKDDPRNAKRVLKFALLVLSFLGFVCMLLMVVFSPQLAQRVGAAETQLGFVAIAPALLLVCTMSALRGYMQGQQNMVPTAISQLIEQVGKVFVALPLAYFGSRVSIAYAAAGVLLGTSIAEGVALLYMFIVYRKQKTRFDALPQNPNLKPTRGKKLLKRLMTLSVPITLGACIIPLAAFIDSSMLVNRLVDTGIFTATEALKRYGRYSGYVLTLINVPTALAAAISMSLVPAISGALAKHDMRAVRQQSSMGLRMAFLIGLPCSVGMSFLSKQLLSLIYHFDTPEALASTAELLSMSACTIILFTVVQATSGILQGLRKQRIPMYTLIAGVAVKIYLNYTLVAIPEINIYGAPMASIACYTISLIPNLYYVLKYADMRLKVTDVILRPLGAAVGMGAVLYLGIKFLPSGRLWTLLLVALGVLSFVGFALLTGALHKENVLAVLRKFRRRRHKGEAQ